MESPEISSAKADASTSINKGTNSKELVRNALKLRRQDITALDKFYLEHLDQSKLNDGFKSETHDVIDFYLNEQTDSSRLEKKEFLLSLKEIFNQRNLNKGLSASDQVIYDCVSESDSDSDIETCLKTLKEIGLKEFVPSEDIILKLLQERLNRNEIQSKDEIKKYLKALKEALSHTPYKNSSDIAEATEDFIDYLMEKAENVEQIKAALDDSFLESYFNLTCSNHNETALKQLLQTRLNNDKKTVEEIRKVLNKYVGDDHTQKKPESESGKVFERIVKHLAKIGAHSIIKAMQDKFFDTNTVAISVDTNTVAISCFLQEKFIEIQTCYKEDFDQYHNEAIDCLFKKAKEYQGNNKPCVDKVAFKEYCDHILFPEKDHHETPFNSLKDGSHVIFEHCLEFELKPLLDNKKQKYICELKHLKRIIKEFTDVSATRNLIKKTARPEKTSSGIPDRHESGFPDRYEISNDDSFKLNTTSKRQKVQASISRRSTNLGECLASLIGVGEGVVAGEPIFNLFSIHVNYFLGATLGIVTLIAGTVLNRFLTRTDSIDMIKAFGLGNFSRFDERAQDKLSQKESFSLPKRIANNVLLFFTAVGTGSVFAFVFIKESLELIVKLIGNSNLIAYIPCASLAFVIAFAELVGISALIHMTNRNMILKNPSSLLESCKKYFIFRFAHVHKGDESLSDYTLILFRILWGAVITLSQLATMAIYSFFTAKFYAATISKLLVTIGVSTSAGCIIGNVTAGINIFTTLLSFSLPAAKVVAQLLDIILLYLVLFPLCAIAAPFYENLNDYLNLVNRLHSRITSKSLLFDYGIEHEIEAKIESQKQPVTPPYPYMESVQKKHNSYNWINKNIYHFFLLANSFGQAALLFPNALVALIQAIRSFGMNKRAIDFCTGKEPCQAEINALNLPAIAKNTGSPDNINDNAAYVAAKI